MPNLDSDQTEENAFKVEGESKFKQSRIQMTHKSWCIKEENGLTNLSSAFYGARYSQRPNLNIKKASKNHQINP